MSSTDQIPVLVVGAGPSALVSALTLLRNGVSVRIIEKEATYHIGERAFGIQPRSMELFKFLGVHEVDEQAALLPPIRTYCPGTMEPDQTFLMYPYLDPSPKFPYLNHTVLAQDSLEELLRVHIEKYSCFIETSTELCSFEQFPDHVMAHVVKKRDGKEIRETIKALWLIGADGARGVVRKQLGLPFLGETRDDLHTIAGDVQLSGKNLGRYWHVFGKVKLDQNIITLRPVTDDATSIWQFFITGPTVDFAKLLTSKHEIFKFLDSLVPTELTFKDLIRASEFRGNVRMVNKLVEGRVFLCGDAAHTHSPYGAQGLNTSVQDAFNLAWKLALVHKGLSPTSLLDTYTTERLPVIAEMLNLTSALLPLGEEVRVGKTISSVERMIECDQKLYMLGINYRNSPIVVDELVPSTDTKPVDPYGLKPDRSMQAGDRAPDAPALVNVKTGGETRFFDIFGPAKHTVLIFVSEAAKAAGIISALERFDDTVVQSVVVLPAGSSVSDTPSYDAVVLEDKDGLAYDHYLVGDETRVVVVRPDGVAGAIVHGTEGVMRYFDGIFIS